MPDMSETECKRCHGEGMSQYSHRAYGICYLCGRAPKGETTTPHELPVETTTLRQRTIHQLYCFILNATEAAEAGHADTWLDDYTRPTVSDILRTADADVAARARAAFAKLGIEF